MADETLHLFMSGLAFVGAFLGGLIRGSKLDPVLLGRLTWLKRSVKGLARHTKFPLEREPLDWDEGTDPGRRL